MQQIERQLTPTVAVLFGEKGHDLVLPPTGPHVTGRGEFAMKVPGTDKTRRVDLVAARWEGDRDIRAVAIECKATVWSVYDGLGQAVQYQSLFDEVYVATPLTLEQDSIARSTLVDLGLGHVRVDMAAEGAYVSVAAQVQRPSRFEPHRKATHVTCRLALGLAFREVAASDRPMRYGFWERGLAIWYGEDVVDHLQWNCWHICRPDGPRADEMGAGINLERSNDIRRICSSGSVDRFQNALQMLPPDYFVEVEHIPNPPAAGTQSIYPLGRPTARATRADDVFRHLQSCDKKHRPRLGVGIQFAEEEWHRFSRWDYEERLRIVREQLAPIMEALTV